MPGLSALDVGVTLQALVEKSLVAYDNDTRRFRILEAVREYGADKLRSQGEVSDVKDRHRAHFRRRLNVAAEHWRKPEEIEWLASLDADYGDLRSALRAYLDDGSDAEACLDMISDLEHYWYRSNRVSEGLDLAEAALRKVAGESPSRKLALAMRVAGNMATCRSNYAMANTYYEAELEMREQLGDRRDLAGALGSLGNTAQYLGDLGRARSLFERALAICVETENAAWIDITLVCMGSAATEAGDYEEAVGYLARAVASSRQREDRFLEAQALDKLAPAEIGLGRYADARRTAEESLSLFAEFKHVPSELGALSNIASSWHLEGNLEQAWKVFAETLGRLSEVLPDISMRLVAIVVEGFSSLCLDIGRSRLAAVCLGFGENSRERCGAPRLQKDLAEMDALAAALVRNLGKPEYDRALAECRHVEPEQALAAIRAYMQE